VSGAHIDLCRLARECVRIFEHRSAAGEHGWIKISPSESTALFRIKPATVDLRPDRLKLELAGGFDHRGYQVVKDQDNGRWYLGWYYEGPWPDEILLTWPIGRGPCEDNRPIRE